jgi:uncharacterized protein YbcV (DUF1398 family)
MKKLIAILVIITSLTTFSCSNDDDANTDLLTGRWYFVSVTYAKEKAATSRIAAEKTVKYIEFKQGGVFTEGYQTGTVATDNATSSYTKNDNIISLSSSKGIVVPLTISKLNNTELVIVYGKNSGREGDTEIYTRDLATATSMFFN